MAQRDTRVLQITKWQKVMHNNTITVTIINTNNNTEQSQKLNSNSYHTCTTTDR